jgi:uncharacterized protein DUF4328
MADYPADEYRDATSLNLWTLRLQYAHVAMSVIAIVSGYMQLELLQAMDLGAFESQEAMEAAAEANDTRQQIVGIFQFVVFITAGVLSLKWIHRACFNARVRAKYMQFTPGWAVGWYFIPIANFWKPYQAMKEIWENTAEQANKSMAEGAWLLGWWWTFWIVSNIFANAAFRMSLRAETIDSLLSSTRMMLASDLVDIPLTFLFIQIVRKVSSAQEILRVTS